MQAIEFEAEFKGDTLRVPPAVAERLTAGRMTRVIVLLEDDPEDTAWRGASYRQFLRDDTVEDSAYDRLR